MFENPAPAVKTSCKRNIDFWKKSKKWWNINYIQMRRKKSLVIGCNNDLFGIKSFFYDPSRILQLFQFVWTLQSSVWVVFNNFLLVDATNKSQISSNPHRIFFDASLYTHSFFANTPFKRNGRREFNMISPLKSFMPYWNANL